MTCSICSQAFDITAEDQRFLDLFNVPAPTQCPDCRLQRRLCERNTRSLYYRKCDLTGQQIISQYHAEQPFPVYGVDAWVSDRWDGLAYGRPFDFARPFFPQFEELLHVVPHLALFNTPGTMQNSDFNNATGYLKNCYLLSESDICEDSYYSNLLKNSKDLCDCSVCYECERCYECVDCISCHTLVSSQDCLQCSDSFCLKNCHGCKDCIGCINQRNKQYMAFNEQYSKQDYEALRSSLALDTRSGLRALDERAHAFFATEPHRALTTERSEDCSGDRIYECKKAVNCFDCKDIEDCRHCQRLSLSCKTCMDFNSWGQNSELVYQCSATGDRAYNSKFCSTCITVTNCEYCFECFHCSDCFGCADLKGKKFCIFNTQYTEQEYHALREKIIAHMRGGAPNQSPAGSPLRQGYEGQAGTVQEYGEYFPMSLCAFAYNESFAPDLFPMTKDEVLARGWRWREESDAKKQYLGAEVVLPETVADVPDELCKQILLCKATSKPYKIIPQELKFYRSMNLPVPEICPDERHRVRTGRRNLYTLYKRACSVCAKDIETTYPPDGPQYVCCDECYFAAVY